MAGKGGKGLLAAKTTAANKDKDKDKDKKRPVSRSSRAGIQVLLKLRPFTSFFTSFYKQKVPFFFCFLKILWFIQI